MTYTSTLPSLRRETGVSAQDGPVMLATKPFNGLDTPLAVARWLAAWEGSGLRAVSVLEEGEPAASRSGGIMLPERDDHDERAALAALIRHELGGDGAEHAGLEVDVLDGPSARTVVDAARACRARVIVVGTGRHEPLGRFIYGERAVEIVALADRPVLVVPREAVAAPPAVAVVAVDFSPASLRAANAVLPMLAPGARLIVVHVKKGAPPSDESVGWWNDAYERRCADRFAQFIRQLHGRPDVTIESKFLRGDIVSSVTEYAAVRGATLIACGRLGHSLVERVFVGSVSSALIRHATCPVLVAPALPDDAAWRRSAELDALQGT